MACVNTNPPDDPTQPPDGPIDPDCYWVSIRSSSGGYTDQFGVIHSVRTGTAVLTCDPCQAAVYSQGLPAGQLPPNPDGLPVIPDNAQSYAGHYVNYSTISSTESADLLSQCHPATAAKVIADYAVAEATGVLADVQASIKQALADCINECSQSTASCQACICSRIGILVDEAMRPVGQCHDRIKSAIDQLTNESVAYLAETDSLLSAATTLQDGTSVGFLTEQQVEDKVDGSGWSHLPIDIIDTILPPLIPPVVQPPQTGDGCPDGQHPETTYVFPAPIGRVRESDLASRGLAASAATGSDTNCVPCDVPDDACPPCGGPNSDIVIVGAGVNLCDPCTIVENAQNLATRLGSAAAESAANTIIDNADPSIITRLFNAAGISLAGSGGIISTAISGVAGWLFDYADDALRSYSKVAGCDSATFTTLATVQGVMAFAEKWTGVLPEALTTNVAYAINFECQYRIPTTDQLNGLFTRQQLTCEQWEAAIKCQGDCVPWQQLIVDASYLKPDVAQLITLERRELIEYDEVVERSKLLGVKDEDALSEFYSLTEVYPTLPDIISFMTRDVADERAVTDNCLDDDFTAKYTDQLKKWSKGQGIPDEVAKFAWRAHWDLPSNTAVYEMIRRLRPGRPKRGGEFDDIDVTIEDARKLLKTNDVAPKWVDPTLAISYATLTRVDIRRMHCIGIIKDEELSDYYQDIGYDKKDADNQAEFTKRLNKESQSCNRTGWTVNKIVNLYKDAGFNDGEASELLEKIGIPQEQIDSLIEGADKELEAKSRILQKKAIRKRFLMGDYETDEAISALTSAGLNLTQANNLTSDWSAERSFKYKQVAAKTLCKWWSDGIIDAGNFQRRLRNIGYTTEDASRMMQSCAGDLAKRKQKEAEAAAKQAKKEAEEERKRLIRACEASARRKRSAAQKCQDTIDPGSANYSGPTFSDD